MRDSNLIPLIVSLICGVLLIFENFRTDEIAENTRFNYIKEWNDTVTIRNFYHPARFLFENNSFVDTLNEPVLIKEHILSLMQYRKSILSTEEQGINFNYTFSIEDLQAVNYSRHAHNVISKDVSSNENNNNNLGLPHGESKNYSVEHHILNVVAAYRSRYNREPPRNFDKWVALALAHGVITDPKHYDQIHFDMLPHRKRGGITNKDLKLLKALPYTNNIEIKGSVILKDGAKNQLSEPLLHTTLSLGLKNGILPTNYFSFSIPWGDEPRSLPMDINQESDQKEIKSEYKSGPDKLKYNLCMKELYLNRKSPTDSLPLGSWYHYFIRYRLTPGEIISPYSLPVFSDCKLPCYHDIVIPRTEFRSYNELFGSQSELLPWRERKNKVMFRGGIGFSDSDGSWRNAIRILLYDWAKFISSIPIGPLRPFEVDVNFSKPMGCQMDKNDPGHYFECLKVNNEYPADTFVSSLNQTRNKYLIVLDGQTWPSRLRKDLSYGSVLFLGTIFVTWCSNMLQPFEHYLPIPIEHSLAGFTSVLFWAVNNSSESEKIANQGQAFANKHLRQIDMVLYTMLAFLEYAELCEFTQW